LDEAQVLAEDARSLAGIQHEQGNEAYALYLHGELAVRREPPVARLPQTSSGRLWHWPKNWACVRSRRTATAVSAHCTARRAVGCRRATLTIATLYRAMDMISAAAGRRGFGFLNEAPLPLQISGPWEA
jgi:hypothetical protein